MEDIYDSIMNEYSAEERRQRRLSMCGKPFYRRKLGTSELEKFFPRCKEWRLCEFCLQHRVEEEAQRLVTLGVLGRIEVAEAEWDTLYRYLHRHGIEYRRFASGESQPLTVLMLLEDAIAVGNRYKVHKLTPSNRVMRVLLLRVPVGKAVSGKLCGMVEAEEETVIVPGWAVRADGVSEGTLMAAWEMVLSHAREDRRADFISLDALVDELEKGNDGVVSALIERATALDKVLVHELAVEFGGAELFGHMRAVKVSEICLLGKFHSRGEAYNETAKPFQPFQFWRRYEQLALGA